MKLSNKNVWLVGGSRGIGEALAEELVLRGARVVITARPSSNLNDLVTRIRVRGGFAEAAPGDVGKQDEIDAACNLSVNALGHVDVVIANVGIYSESWPANFNAPEYLSIMDINYGGMVRTFQAVIPHFLARKAGVLVATASVAGYRGLPRAAAYASSKSAVITFVESIRFHLRDKGIRAVVINPGFVLTRLTERNEFFMPSLMSPTRAARYICDGLEREKDTISFPPVFAGFLALLRVIPFKLYDRCTRAVWQTLKNPKLRVNPRRFPE